MTRVLIVDDDPFQLRLLARVISLRGTAMSVLTANGGAEAIQVLERNAIDLVLTDLQMPDVSGFDLLAWLIANQPQVTVFTMTAYPHDEGVSRLRELGSVECFTKPLDVQSVLERITSTLEKEVRGHVRNLSLASLLQLIEMERKTCTLTVESAGRVGHLFVRGGQLIDARWQGGDGTPAAIAIAAWSSPAITIASACRTQRETVDRPLGFIVMEAMRILDEEERAAKELPPPEPSGPPSSLPPPERPSRTVSEFPVGAPRESGVILIVDRATGRVRTATGVFERLDALAAFVTEIFSAKLTALATMDLQDDLEELVITTKRYWALARPLPLEHPSLVVLLFEPTRATLPMQRLELDRFMAALDAWTSL